MTTETESRIRIVAAAVRLNGSGAIISLPEPKRHGDIISAMHYAGISMESVALATQGFLTSEGLFVDRRKAAIIALVADQVSDNRRQELFTEDLW